MQGCWQPETDPIGAGVQAEVDEGKSPEAGGGEPQTWMFPGHFCCGACFVVEDLKQPGFFWRRKPGGVAGVISKKKPDRETEQEGGEGVKNENPMPAGGATAGMPNQE